MNKHLLIQDILRLPDAADTTSVLGKDTNVVAEGDTVKVVKETKGNKVRRYLPFAAAIFSKPDRLIRMDRTNKKGEKTGVIAELKADVLIPMLGGVGIIKTSIWCDSKYDREAGGTVETYNLSLSRNFFTVVDGQRDEYDAFRQNVLDEYEKWMETDAAKGPSVKASNAPRLVKIIKDPAKTDAATPAAR